MVTDLGEDIGVPKHYQRAIGLGARGKTARMARGLGTGDLQCEITQRIGAEQGLIHRRGIGGAVNGGRTWGDDRLTVALKLRTRPGEVLDAVTKRRYCGGFRGGGSGCDRHNKGSCLLGSMRTCMQD